MRRPGAAGTGPGSSQCGSPPAARARPSRPKPSTTTPHARRTRGRATSCAGARPAGPGRASIGSVPSPKASITPRPTGRGTAQHRGEQDAVDHPARQPAPQAARHEHALPGHRADRFAQQRPHAPPHDLSALLEAGEAVPRIHQVQAQRGQHQVGQPVGAGLQRRQAAAPAPARAGRRPARRPPCSCRCGPRCRRGRSPAAPVRRASRRIGIVPADAPEATDSAPTMPPHMPAQWTLPSRPTIKTGSKR